MCLGTSCCQFRGKHSRTECTGHLTDGMLRILHLLYSVPDCGFYQLHHSQCRLQKFVLSIYCGTNGSQQLYQRFQANLLWSSLPVISDTFPSSVSTLSSTPPSTVSSRTASDVSCQYFAVMFAIRGISTTQSSI